VRRDLQSMARECGLGIPGRRVAPADQLEVVRPPSLPLSTSFMNQALLPFASIAFQLLFASVLSAC